MDYTIDMIWTSSRLELLLVGAVLVAIFFALLWLQELATSDASLVDMGWALALGGLAAFYAWWGDGYSARQLWLVALVGSWSARLAFHIYWRHRGGGEDGRYQSLRAGWGEQAHRNFFLFYQAQGLLAVMLSTPFLLIATHPAERFEWLEVAGAILAAAAFGLETVSDAQLSRHRRDPSNKGKTCRSGLWRYSRHPNYFFEWLIWVGIGIAALSAPYGVLGLMSPLVMLFLIVNVTGIPPTEERALESRGQDYRRYQQTTSAFVPWFPRKEHAS